MNKEKRKYLLSDLDDLGYRIKDKVDAGEFFLAVKHTLSHIDDMEEAKEALDMALSCYEELENLEKDYEKNKSIYKAYYKKHPLGTYFSLVSDEEAHNSLWVSNVLFYNLLLFTFFLPESEYLENSFFNEVALSYPDGSYSLHSIPHEDSRMMILDRNGKQVCIVAMDDDYQLYLEENDSPYCIYDRSFGYVAIFKKDYIATLKEGQEPDMSESIGEIEWDVHDEEVPEFGLARTATYDDEHPLPFFALLALSAFFMYGETNAPEFPEEGLEHMDEDDEFFLEDEDEEDEDIHLA